MPTPVAAPGRGRRWARRRPVRSPSATTATLADGSVTPRCSGATTIAAAGLRSGRRSARRRSASRALVEQQAAQAGGRAVAVGGDDDPVTGCASSSLSRWTRPSPSPTTGPQPDASTIGVSGDSGAESIVQTPTAGARREQPVGLGVQPRERQVGVARPRRSQRLGEVVLLGEQVGGPVAACAAARRARPSPASGSTSVSSRSSSTSHGSQLSMPVEQRRPRRAAPTARGPTARRRRASSARPRTSSVGISSRAGKISASSRSADERWSLTPNVVSRSTSSPHRSMRTGASAVDGNTSMIAPRRANSPRCSTSSSRR